MTDFGSFLAAIEADPLDDATWLVFADWLEEHGDPMAPAVRSAVETGRWDRLRGRIFRPLGQQSKRKGACDAVERVVPLFERAYPDDQSPRSLLALARGPKPGREARLAQADVHAACNRADRDVSRNYSRFLAPSMAIHSAMRLVEAPVSAFEPAAFAAVVDRFGAKVGSTPEERHPPQWAAAFQLEYRWQVARLLRYRPSTK